MKPRKPMRNYLKPQSVGDLLSNTFAIYGKGFVPVLLTYLVPVFPFQLWQAAANAADHRRWALAGYLVGIVAGLFAFGAMTITVADICLGNRPSVARSYKRLFSTIPGKLALTNVLTVTSWQVPWILLKASSAQFGRASGAMKFLLVGAIIICAVAEITAVARLMFASSVVVLEGVWGFKALKRSNALARGLVWRNLGTLGLVFVLVLIVIIFAAVAMTFAHLKNGSFGAQVFTDVVTSLLVPPFFIAVVLLYYDTRARKEAYDSSALAEDLRR